MSKDKEHPADLVHLFSPWTSRQTRENVEYLLTMEQQTALGPVNEDWFEDLCAKRSDGRLSKNVTGGSKKLKKEDPNLMSPTLPGNEITSPDGPVGATICRYGQNKHSLYQNSDQSPATPGQGAATPIQSAGAATDESFSLRYLLSSSSSRNSKMHGKKSSGVNQLKKSLGIDLDESGLSWTSSLATPPTHVILEGASAETHWDDQEYEPSTVICRGPSRKLFDPTDLESSQEFDTTSEKIEAMALVSENEECDRTEDHKLMDDVNGTEDIENETTADMHCVSSRNVSKESTNQPNSSQLSQSGDDMLGFINTPPSRVKSMKKSAPKVKRVKQMHGSQDLYFQSPSQKRDNLQDIGVSKAKESDKDESADTEVTFKTPITKEHAGKCSVELESPVDLFSQISPSTLEVACKAAECADIQQYQSSQNECTTQEEHDGGPCSTGFETCDNGDDNLKHMLPLTSGRKPIVTATSTPMASNCEMDLDVDITPIGKTCHDTPVRWKKVVSSKDAEVPTDNVSPVQIADETKIKSGLGLRRKAKRFSYPSSSQIRETCPKKVFNFEEKCDNHTAGKKEIVFEKGNPNMNEGNVVNQTSNASHLKHDNRIRLDSEKGGTVAVKPYWKRFTSGFTSLTTYNREAGSHDIPISPQKPKEINDCSGISSEIKGCDEKVEFVENTSKNLNSCFNYEHKGKCDINTSECTTGKVEVIPQSVSFQSASGKHIGISDAARKKAAGLLTELENGSDDCVKPLSEKARALLDKEDGPTQKLLKDGSTYSNKKVDSNILGDNVEIHKTCGGKLLAPTEEFGANQNESLTGDSIPQFVSFQSAGGKKIAISEKATMKAQQLMAEVSMEQDITRTADEKSYRDDSKGNLKDSTKVSDGFKPFKAPKPASSTNRKNCEQSLLNNVNTKDDFTDAVAKSDEANGKSEDEFSGSLDGLTSTQIAKVFLETDDDMAWTQIQSQRSIEDDTSNGEIEIKEEPRPSELFGNNSGLLHATTVVDEPRSSSEPREEVISNVQKVETDEGVDKPEKGHTENRINSSGVDLAVVISRSDIACKNHSQWDPLEVNDSFIRLTDDPSRNDVSNQAKIEDVEEEIGMQLDPKLEQGVDEARNCNANSLLNMSVKSPSFVTASGYAIMIQDELYGAAKELFSDINDDRECGEPIPLSPEEQGVSNTVETHENELSAKEYEERKIESEELSKSKYDGSTLGKTFEVGFCGFQTAGGQKVSVSEESLKKIQADHILCDSSEKCLNAIQPEIYGGDAIVGFQTAREEVKISKELLTKLKGIFEEPCGTGDMDRCSKKTGDEGEKNLVDPDCSSTKRKSFVSFETTAGRNLGISEINIENVSKKVTQLFDDTQKQETDFANKGFAGFSTASGRKVSVSEEALKQVEGMFCTEENEGCNVHMKAVIAPSVPLVTNNTVCFTGFQTAEGSKVTVALERTKNLFSDVSPHEENYAMKETNDVSKESNNMRINKGFQTASGSAVTVSKANFEKAQNLLVHNKEDITPIFDGFTSESGKKISVSDAALLKVKAVSQKYDGNVVASVKSFTGFQTAGGSAVTVSEKALQQAAKCHESVREFEVPDLPEACYGEQFPLCANIKTDITATNAEITFTNVSSEALKGFTGFQTGRGQKVSVSKEALKKARTILTENDKCEDVEGDEQKETHFDIETEAKESTKALLADEESSQWNDWPDCGGFSNAKLVSEQNVYDFSESKPGGRRNDQEETKLNGEQGNNRDFDNCGTRVFTTPSKTIVPTSGFKTPIKKSKTPFKTPIKSSTSFITPSKRTIEFSEEVNDCKKPRLDVQAHISDGESQEERIGCRAKEEVVKARTKAKVAQGQRIRAKKEKNATKPVMGQLMSCKMKNMEKCTLSETMGGIKPGGYTKQQLRAYGVLESTMNVRASNAESYRFVASEHCDKEVADTADCLKLGDGGSLVLDDTGTAGKKEFCLALFDMDGVEPKLISHDRVYNHYKWIVWKLAAVEVSFPSKFGGRCLTPHEVMLQLKYRYDKEVDLSQRSALKKIYEQDDTPAKAMVLCVASIDYATGTNHKEPARADGDCVKVAKGCSLLLTDGWYSMRCVIDGTVNGLIQQGRVRVGDKLCVFGAELVGNPEPAPPLQAPPDVMMKISANGTRRARWDARLGYLRNPQPPVLPLRSLYPSGGMVACVDIVVTRIYPPQYMEKMTDGTSVWRCERAELKAARKYEQERSKHMEKLFAKLQAEFEKESDNISTSSSQKTPRKKWTEKEILSLHTGYELYEALVSTADPASLEVCLSRNQLELLSDYRRKLQEERQQELQAQLRKQMSEANEGPTRNVVPLMKIRVAGCSTKDLDTKTSTILTIWRPQAGVLETLKEGKRFKIYSLMAGENRGRQASCKTSLTVTRSTRYQEIDVDDNFLDLLYEPREVASVRELKPNFQPFGNEVDVVGMVVHVSRLGTFDRQSGSEGSVQNMYLVDVDGDICSIKCWGGLAAYGVDDLLDTKCIVACTNLLWRPDDGNSVPTLTVTDTSVFAVNPRDSYLSAATKKFKSLVQRDTGDFMKCAEDKMQRLLCSFARSGYSNIQNQRRNAMPPSMWDTSKTLTDAKSLPQRRYSSMYNTGVKRSPVNDPQRTNICNQKPSEGDVADKTEPKMLVESPQGNKVSSAIPIVVCDDEGKSESTDQTLRNEEHKKNDGNNSICSSIIKNDEMKISVNSDILPNRILEDPKLVSRRALQKIKSRQLLDYGIAPCLSPLVSPIPDKVRKAFKPPSRNSPLTPVRTMERPVAKVIGERPEKSNENILSEESADTVRINLNSKLTESTGEDSRASVLKDVSNRDTNNTIPSTSDDIEAKIVISTEDSQDSATVSDSSQSSSREASNQTSRKQRRSGRKRNRTESEELSASETTSPVNKRRTSLRLRNK